MWGWLTSFLIRRKLAKVRAALTANCKDSVNPVCAFGGGRSAVVLLHLLHEISPEKFPCRVLRLTTGQTVPALDAVTAAVGQRWHLEILTLELGGLFPEQLAVIRNPDECCRYLRVEGLMRAAQAYRFDTLLTGLRADDPDAHRISDARARLGVEGLRWLDPLRSLTAADIDWIIRHYNLPDCQLYAEQAQVSCSVCLDPRN